MTKKNLEYFLQFDGTQYQLRAEMLEAGLLFNLTVRNGVGSLYEAGEAREREGDLESYDDGDGRSYLVRSFRYRTPDCKLNIAIDIDNADFAWILWSESVDEKEGLRYACPLPLERVYG